MSEETTPEETPVPEYFVPPAEGVDEIDEDEETAEFPLVPVVAATMAVTAGAVLGGRKALNVVRDRYATFREKREQKKLEAAEELLEAVTKAEENTKKEK